MDGDLLGHVRAALLGLELWHQLGHVLAHLQILFKLVLCVQNVRKILSQYIFSLFALL